MQIDRNTRQDDQTWRLETIYLGQHVNFTLDHAEIRELLDGENPSEAQVVDALRDHEADLEAGMAAVVGDDGTPPAKFGSLKVDPTAG